MEAVKRDIENSPEAFGDIEQMGLAPSLLFPQTLPESYIKLLVYYAVDCGRGEDHRDITGKGGHFTVKDGGIDSI